MRNYVFIPFVTPEALIRSILIFPVGVHIGQESSFAERLKDGPYIAPLPGRITVGIECAIAVIRPGMLVLHKVS